MIYIHIVVVGLFSTIMKLQVLLLGVLCLKYTYGQRASVACLSTSDPTVFDVVFRYDVQSVSGVTAIRSYDAADLETEAPGPGCENSTLVGSIYSTQYTVNTTAASLPCGVMFDGVRIYSGAISPVGSDQIYTFACNSSDLDLPETVLTSVNTGHLQNEIAFVTSPGSAKLSVVQAGTNIPLSEFRVGEYMGLVVTYNDGKFPSAQEPNMLGMKFHVAPMTRATGYIEIYTLGLPTRVTVSGQLPGYTFTETFVVSRDKSTQWTIPVAYWPEPFNSMIWARKSNVISIASDDWIIGAKLTQADRSVMIFPDKYLSRQYRMAGQAVMHTVSIIATEDGTDITFTGNFIGHLLDMMPVTNGRVVNMNSMETIQMHCYFKTCEQYWISSNKNVGVVVGGNIGSDGVLSPSDLVQQLPAKKYLDSNFVVLPNVTNEEYTLVPYTLDPYTVTTASGVFANESAVDALPDSYRLTSTTPLYVFAPLATASKLFNDKTYIPSPRQWSNRNLFYLTKEYEYDLFIVAFNTTDNSIEVQTPSSPATPLVGAMFQTVNPYMGAAADADYVSSVVISYPVTETGMYEFRSPRSFLMIVKETKNGIPSNLHSLGMRLTCINPCVPQTSRYALRGNGIDDDCDNFVDEDVINGLDDEPVPDGTVDEDPPISDDAALFEVRVNQLYAASTADFSDGILLIDNECPSTTPSSLQGIISSFAPITTLNDALTDLLVLGTQAFKAFRIRGAQSQQVFFRAVVELCFGDECTQAPTCSRRKKRSAEIHHIETSVTIRDRDYGEESGWRECESTWIYWIPHFLLVAIICVEASATAYFLFKKSKLKTL